MNALEARGLAKTYAAADGNDPLHALSDISLELGAGEFVSLVGPSGCGKSTLLKILAGLIAPSGGDVLLDGAKPDVLLGCVGYMPQDDLLMAWRTTLDNVSLGLELAGVSRADARVQARAELSRFGLEGFERHWPRALSGGMRQRAALLRTFLAGRDVLLLDEPLGALDALTREEMREWLLEVWEADRKTILMVTHDVEEAVFLSDRVYVMSPRPGRVTATVEVPLRRPRVQELTTTAEFIALEQAVRAPLREARAGLA
ncbi:MAG: ABC transporter ATP-binding protein [Solirubrobacteraceae bacterium]|jgi:ABC-type nitrate/sulfonate/bicarbonate transport system ATPase subunit